MSVPRAPEPVHASRLDRLGLGGRDAPAIYRSLLATTLIAVQWRYDPSVELIAFSLFVSIGVFWLTHLWVELVDRRVQGPITQADAARAARGELPMLAAGVLPSRISPVL